MSFTFLFTWDFIHMMAFSGPINLYLTGIFKPYKTKPYKTHSFFQSLHKLMEQPWQWTKTDKIVYSSFLEHALQLSCNGKLLPQTYCARFFFWCNFQITVFSLWCPNVHVVHKYIAKVSNPLYWFLFRSRINRGAL